MYYSLYHTGVRIYLRSLINIINKIAQLTSYKLLLVISIIIYILIIIQIILMI